MAAISSSRVTDERVTCVRIFADAHGETHIILVGWKAAAASLAVPAVVMLAASEEAEAQTQGQQRRDTRRTGMSEKINSEMDPTSEEDAIRATASDGSFTVAVRDTGPGILEVGTDLTFDLERFPLRLNWDSQSGRKGGVSARIRLLGGAHMARPYSSDLRERVVEAVNEGATRSEAAERFGVGVSSAVRWHQAWRETGTVEAKPCGGSRSPLEDYAEEIIALVEDQRDRTLDEIVAAMHERRIPGSRTSLFRFLEAPRHHIQKKFCTRASKSVRTWPAPQALEREQGLLDSSRLVFIDEHR